MIGVIGRGAGRIVRRGAMSLCCVAIAATSVAQQEYEIIDLGTLGGAWSRPYDINESGVVVGSSQIRNGEDYHGWFWMPDSGMVDLRTFGGPNSKGRSVNNHGHLVGWAEARPGRWRAAYWSYSTGPVDLGTLGGSTSKARGINDDGEIVGMARDADGHSRAFITRLHEPLTALGTLGGPNSEARAINQLGEVAGWAHDSAGNQRAFYWSVDTGMIDCGTLGGDDSWGYGINDRGEVVGEAEVRGSIRHAFVWTQREGMINLGALGGDRSGARGTNNDGLVVGRAMTGEGEWRAFIWDRVGGMRDLNDLIAPDSGWLLRSARAINDDGYIVAIAEGAVESHAVLLAPPLTLHAPVPGLAGVDNQLAVANGVPGATVTCVWSLNSGQALISRCPGVALDVEHPNRFGRETIHRSGSATIDRFVRASASGRRVWFQTIEQETCRVSDSIVHDFP